MCNIVIFSLCTNVIIMLPNFTLGSVNTAVHVHACATHVCRVWFIWRVFLVLDLV